MLTRLPKCPLTDEMGPAPEVSQTSDIKKSLESSDSGSTSPMSNQVEIIKDKRLQLNASPFPHGCICGHNTEHRCIVYETRKRINLKAMGITIRPKIRPLAISLRN